MLKMSQDLKTTSHLLGQKGLQLKVVCGFYIRNDIKYKQRKYLDISYYDDNNEFQSSWIDIIRGKNQMVWQECFTNILKTDNIFSDKLD